MKILVNGETHEVAEATTVATLLVELGLTGKRIAIERNGEIAPRSQHAAIVLQPGDRLEIVHAIGGG